MESTKKVSQMKSLDTFIQEMKDISPSIEVIGNYQGARTHIAVKCTICGNTWEAMPTNLLKGKGCPKCAVQISAEKRRRSETEFTDLLAREHPTVVAEEGYKGSQVSILFRCKKCGNSWRTSPSSIINGHACPKCAKNKIYTTGELKW